MHPKICRASLPPVGVAALAMLLTACQPQPPAMPAPGPGSTLSSAPAPAPPVEPPASTLIQGLAEALIDTGFYEEVSITDTIGQHYIPGDDSWKVLACFEFSALDGSQGTNCIDSINAFQLSNQIWIVGVTINEVYRWRAIGQPAGAPPAAQGTAGQEGD